MSHKEGVRGLKGGFLKLWAWEWPCTYEWYAQGFWAEGAWFQ